uniref:Uncharacterized protein LOC100183340 n=1 Tax=Phallusia mammillata TaxID=59560 RepID=A0A6F9DIR3_9ASCI|nr:uncharacterized protein LOC100183340 [Phallusia mammillata]
MFLKQQLLNITLPPNARRYHPDLVRWCIEFYCRSPAAYEHIRASDVLTLPSPTTIKRYRNFIKPQPGINQMSLDEIERVSTSVSELVGFLTLDEMKIKENLVMKDNKLVGFVDLDYSGADLSNDIATHVLVFYVRTVKRKVSLPIAWYPTKVTPAPALALIFWKILLECESRGLQIHAVIADGMATNRQFFKLISGKKEISLLEPLHAPNPICPSRPVYLCSDPSHLLKTARNSLFSSKPGGSKYMNRNGKDILWTHVVELYNTDKDMPLLRKTNLSLAHIQLNSCTKVVRHSKLWRQVSNSQSRRLSIVMATKCVY